MSFVPKKSLGQNFLLNQEIIEKIVELGDIRKNSVVIEIGPGTGNLTLEILKKNPHKVFAIEKDNYLFRELKKKFNQNINFINEDVLKINWSEFSNHKNIVFGNLPYNISAKLLINLIKLDNLNIIFKKFVFMFQKEVADRIVADVNTNKYGRLTILTSWKMQPKKIKDKGSKNFYPKPNVDSSVICFEPKDNFFRFNNSENLEKVTNIFFQNKRKMIKKPLNILFKDSSKIIKKLQLDEKSRPQNLSAETFFKISKEYEKELNLY